MRIAVLVILLILSLAFTVCAAFHPNVPDDFDDSEGPERLTMVREDQMGTLYRYDLNDGAMYFYELPDGKIRIISTTDVHGDIDVSL